MAPADGVRPTWFRDVGERFTGTELLFDLVFVLCVSRLTASYRDDPTWERAAVALLLFVPVWWAWTGVTFATDRFPADGAPARALIVGAAAATAVMALAIPSVPGSGEVPFALGYAAERLLLALFYVQARRSGPDGGRLARFYAAGFALVAVVWAGSALLPGPIRVAAWVAAMALDVAMPRLADRGGRLLPVDQGHLADRCGAFVIIVVGEAVVETLTLAGEERPTVLLGATTAAAGAVAVGLWWGFFDRGSWRRRYEALGGSRSGQVAATVCAYLHFPVVAGIAAAAAGLQLAVLHPASAVGAPAAAALVVGCALYLGAMNLMTRVLRVPRAESLTGVRLVLAAVLLVLLAVGSGWSPVAFLAAVGVVLAAHAAAGGRRGRSDRSRRHPRG